MSDAPFRNSLELIQKHKQEMDSAEKKWEFRYNQQKKKQRELEETIVKMISTNKELKNG